VIWAALLAGIAGYVDAICFLCLGNVFAANMTGNLVEIGIGAAMQQWEHAGWCATVTVSFLLGVIAARLLRRFQSARVPLLVEVALLLVAATGWLGVAALPLLAAAMAMQNAVVTHGIVAVNVTFVTGDIQQLGEGLFRDLPVGASGRTERKSMIIVAVLVSYALGAALGTLASPLREPALLVPAAVLAGIALLGSALSRREAPP
jgi:uncharacterized membrane protein YoaK (UPF0700 family)